MRGAPTCQLTFTDVEVPAAWRLGEEGEGFKLAMSALDEGRLGVGAFALGLARGALEIALEYAKERETFGKPIIQHQGLGFLLADQIVDLGCAYRLWRQAIDAFGREPSRAASTICGMAKLATTNMAMRVTTEAVQVIGGVGLTKELRRRADVPRREDLAGVRGLDADPAVGHRAPSGAARTPIRAARLVKEMLRSTTS